MEVAIKGENFLDFYVYGLQTQNYAYHPLVKKVQLNWRLCNQKNTHQKMGVFLFALIRLWEGFEVALKKYAFFNFIVLFRLLCYNTLKDNYG